VSFGEVFLTCFGKENEGKEEKERIK